MIKFIAMLAILIALVMGTTGPIFSKGFFPIHDDTQVGRVVEMGRALRNGQFPVRWVSDLGYGYGYPLFNFYGPLPYYVGGGLYAIGLSGLDATKAVFILGTVGSAITMFLLMVPIVGGVGALVSAVAYAYAPYHAVQVYIRGSVGEFWVLVFLPIIVLGVWKILSGQKIKGIIAGAIGIAGAVLSHTLLGYTTALIVGVFILGTYIWMRATRRVDYVLLGRLSRTLVLGLGLSAFFWLPAIVEMPFTNVAGQIGPTSYWNDHFVCLPQLWNSVWGFGGSSPGCVDGISFKLGKVHLILFGLGVFALIIRRPYKKNPLLLGISKAVGVFTVLSFFMLLPVSLFIWNVMPGLVYLQYPWRFLTYSIFGLSFFAGLSVLLFPNRVFRIGAASIALFILILVNGKLFVPQYTYEKDSSAFETTEELRFRVSKISDEYLPHGFGTPKRAEEIARDTLTVPSGSKRSMDVDTETYIRAGIILNIEGEMIFNRVYFPGWIYLIDGKPTEAVFNNQIPSFRLSPGDHVFEARFENTPVRNIGNVISIASVVFVFWLLSKYEKANS